MILPGLPGGNPLPRRALFDALNVWLPTDEPDPFPKVEALELPRRRPRPAERFLYETRMSFGLAQWNSHAIISNVIDPGTPEEIMDDLFMADPDAYRLLSEHIVLPDAQHDAAMSEWRDP